MATSDLDIRRRRMVERIYADFKGVTREGGVSWSESIVVDSYGDEDDQAAARASDVETDWMALVNDPNWVVSVGKGGWSFLDAIGTRYYVAPAMVRQLEERLPRAASFAESTQCLEYSLDISGEGRLADWHRDKFSTFTVRQRRCVRGFLKLMVYVEEQQRPGDAVVNASGGEECFEKWKRLLERWTEEWCAAGLE
ncbi:hypothetical protein BH11PLA1_BH11PLA1_07210 [soil metagenome]